MKQQETDVWKSLLLQLSPKGYRLFRNQRYKGKSEKGFWVDAGVGGNGGSDLIGYRIVKVTKEMVGSDIAVFVAIETKAKRHKKYQEQIDFIDQIKKDGGEAFFYIDTQTMI